LEAPAGNPSPAPRLLLPAFIQRLSGPAMNRKACAIGFLSPPQ